MRNRAIFVRYKTYMPYDPTVAPISNRISALGNTPAPIHFTLCIVRHIDYTEPIEHSVDVGHAPDIAQRFWTVNHCSDLFYIAQRQQHRAPRQTFAVFPAVDPEFFCVWIKTNLRRVAQRQSTVGLNSPSIFICCSFLWVKTELPKASYI